MVRSSTPWCHEHLCCRRALPSVSLSPTYKSLIPGTGKGGADSPGGGHFLHHKAAARTHLDSHPYGVLQTREPSKKKVARAISVPSTSVSSNIRLPLSAAALEVQPGGVDGPLEARHLLLLGEDQRQRREGVSEEPPRPLARPLCSLPCGFFPWAKRRLFVVPRRAENQFDATRGERPVRCNSSEWAGRSDVSFED